MMADTPAPKRDSREPTPGAPGLSSAEFEKMMEELEAGIEKARSTRAPLTAESALEQVKSEGITDRKGALRRAASMRAMERTNEERRREAQDQIRRRQAPPMREKSE